MYARAVSIFETAVVFRLLYHGFQSGNRGRSAYSFRTLPLTTRTRSALSFRHQWLAYLGTNFILINSLLPHSAQKTQVPGILLAQGNPHARNIG